MPTKNAKNAREIPALDENALKMLDDHSCCGPVGEEAESVVEQTRGTSTTKGPGTQQGTQQGTQLPVDLRTSSREVPDTPGAPASFGTPSSPMVPSGSGVVGVAAVPDEQAADRANGLAKKASPRNSRRVGFRVRMTGFLAVALLILGTALWLVRPMDLGEQAADYTVEISMSGFTPAKLDFPVGKAVTLKLVNMESPFHISGALHQFAVDALGINEKLDAKQTRIITIPAQKASQYTFYCDVCCGGKKSPTMRGTLTFQ